MWKVHPVLLAVVILVSLSCEPQYGLAPGVEESPETELHNTNLAITALMADPDLPVNSLDEFPTNSFVECNPEGGSCTRDMEKLGSINSGSVNKYGINEGSSVADYMESPETNYWYCTDVKGHVTGYLKETCLPEDDILRH